MDNCVASCIKYRDKEDLMRWMKTFPTKYKKYELDEIFAKTKPGSFIVWSYDQGLFIY